MVLKPTKKTSKQDKKKSRYGVCIYDLVAQGVRIDSTSAKSYSQKVEGLLSFGHSKAHRPDLPQVKIMCRLWIRWSCH